MALGAIALTFFEGRWHEGNLPIIGAADHAAWHGNLVFDGARYFEGVTPDLDRHMARVIRSAEAMGLAPPVTGPELEEIVRDGLKRLDPALALYIRPMIWPTDSGPAILDPLPESTRFAVCLEALPLREPGPMPITVSPYRRPRQDTALTEAKAACLYPNNARIIAEARRRGFANALSLDLEDHVAETASTNVFMVRDGVVLTPAPNGTFLDGITRQRVIALLREDGFDVREVSLTVEDFRAADEIFLTGNASKVVPVTALDERRLQPGPVARRAREAYWDFAHSRR